MAIGPTLQEARQNKQLTASQVAEMTRMKVQIVEDLEHDDFHRIAATIYGKGFIKLYAEAVDLDPAPLIEDYLVSVGKAPPPTASRAVEPKADSAALPQDAETVGNLPAADKQEPADEPTTPPPPDDLFSYSQARKHTVSAAPKTESEPTDISSTPGRATAPRAQAAIDACRTLWHQCQQTSRTIWQNSKTRVMKWLETFTRSDAHDKWMQRILLIVAACAVVLILITLTNLLLRQREPSVVPDHELILFTTPPEPFAEQAQ